MPSAQPRRRALLIDADGTLWDTRTAMEYAGRAGVRAVWPQVSPAVATAAALRFRSDPLGAFRRFVAGELTFLQMRSARLVDAASVVAEPVPEDALAVFEGAYGPAFDATLTAFADTVPLLRWCAENGVPVRVLTNSATAYTVGKVAATGLTGLIGAVCSRDCLGVGKPEASVFRHACAELGSDPEDVLYVGDEWTSDALGASEAGLASAWLVRDDGDPAGEVVATAARRAAALARGIPVIGSLAEVPGLLGLRETGGGLRAQSGHR